MVEVEMALSLWIFLFIGGYLLMPQGMFSG
jgi:hypothetical protein